MFDESQTNEVLFPFEAMSVAVAQAQDEIRANPPTSFIKTNRVITGTVLQMILELVGHMAAVVASMNARIVALEELFIDEDDGEEEDFSSLDHSFELLRKIQALYKKEGPASLERTRSQALQLGIPATTCDELEALMTKEEIEPEDIEKFEKIFRESCLAIKPKFEEALRGIGFSLPFAPDDEESGPKPDVTANAEPEPEVMTDTEPEPGGSNVDVGA